MVPTWQIKASFVHKIIPLNNFLVFCRYSLFVNHFVSVFSFQYLFLVVSSFIFTCFSFLLGLRKFVESVLRRIWMFLSVLSFSAHYIPFLRHSSLFRPLFNLMFVKIFVVVVGLAVDKTYKLESVTRLKNNWIRKWWQFARTQWEGNKWKWNIC